MTAEGNPHHLIMGTLTDYLSKETVPDTHDERYRQKLARILVEQGGFEKESILSAAPLTVHAGTRKALIKVDFLIKIDEKIAMLVKYAPGSLVTRRLSTLALSRILAPYQIPLAVITNGEDAETIDGHTGAVLSSGIGQIPDHAAVVEKIQSSSFSPVTKKIAEQASRIAFACEVDGACPCDTDVCVLDNSAS